MRSALSSPCFMGQSLISLGCFTKNQRATSSRKNLEIQILVTGSNTGKRWRSIWMAVERSGCYHSRRTVTSERFINVGSFKKSVGHFSLRQQRQKVTGEHATQGCRTATITAENSKGVAVAGSTESHRNKNKWQVRHCSVWKKRTEAETHVKEGAQ